MQFREFQLARLSGVPLIIDYSWPLVALAHVALLVFIYLPFRFSRISPLPLWQTVLCALVMTSLLFASIIAHELAHAGAAKLEGIETIEIRLHFFGGWAKLASEPKTPMAEFRISIVGPVSSFLLALIFGAGEQITLELSNRNHSLVSETFSYLFFGNLLLAMFNLFPGLPLDGGRAFRAWLWYRKKDILAATRTATRMGVALAYMLISYGIYRAVWYRDLFSAVGLVAIGLFLKNSAENDYRYRKQQREYEQAMEQSSERVREQWNVTGTVGAVMTSPPVIVAPGLRIAEFVDQVLSKHRHTSFPVARDGRLHGILSLERLREVPEEKWEETSIGEVMQPVDDSLFITVRSSVEYAARKLRTSPVNHLAVLDGEGLLVGYLSPADLGK
ncbi:MAG TPA: site-2 protease family protein [Blastocatellia bacterium]|nr:site-2 protease family protein [Blastocatellia bacterium]